MQRCLIAAATVFLCLATLTACGGSKTALLAPDVPVDSSSAPAAEEAAGLPGLAELPEPNHDVSAIGPGWCEINPKQTLRRAGGQPSLPGQIVLAAEGQTAFAIYGLMGFDGDSFPTSVRLDLADVAGNYFIAFSDYVSGGWRFTGSYVGPATVEIPGLDGYTDPSAYVSQRGWHYFAIIIPDGGGVTVNGVEVGVDGGTLGPYMPTALDGQGGEHGFYLRWAHSASVLAADFAGYRLQRAPLAAGEFADLTDELITVAWFHDETAELDVSYRYRIAAVDTSGNLSDWDTLINGPVTGDASYPVVDVEIPRGPFYAPTEITLDLSGSFDPDGHATDYYGVQLYNSPVSINGMDPQITVTLQPGTYWLVAKYSAGGYEMRTYVPVIAYPRWQNESVVVKEPDPAGLEARLRSPRGGLLPGTERMVICGLDRTMPGLVFWVENEAGGSFEPLLRPAYTNPESAFDPFLAVSYIGEPVVLGDSLCFPVCMMDSFMLACCDGTDTVIINIGTRSGSAAVSAVTDGDAAWLIYERVGGGAHSLIANRVGGTGNSHELVGNLEDGLSNIDAVYNTANRQAEIAVRFWDGANNITHWLQWDPALDVVGLDHTLGIAVSTGPVDIEIDPATNEAAVLFGLNDGITQYHYYTTHLGLGAWSANLAIDNSANNRPACDLLFAGDRAYAYFGLLTGVSALYELDGGWSARNTTSLGNDPGMQLVLFDDPESDAFVVLDGDSDENFRLLRMLDDGSDALYEFELPTSEGQGFEMYGIGGADGLHAIWHSASTSVGRHVTSPDGETWTTQADLPGLSNALDLTTNVLGEVYVSYVNPMTNDAQLRYWDGADFVLQETIGGCEIGHRPFLSRHTLSPDIHWMVDRDVPPHTMYFVHGNVNDGFSTTTDVLSDFPVWTGAALPGWGMVDRRYMVITGGAAMDEGLLGFQKSYDGTFEPYVHPLFSYPLNCLVARETFGKTLDTAAYIGPEFNQYYEVCWAAQGESFNPFRLEMTFPLFGEAKTTPLNMDLNLLHDDLRRTVSSATAWGPTAVGLISNLGSTQNIFEWSNFGGWENLPLPDGLDYMTMPELVVGYDGRWHLLYKNYRTDQIMCRSTL
ncbi:hypothetical protein JW859_03970 [bacterium]|nr:hypothetical protein [bacterium]